MYTTTLFTRLRRYFSRPVSRYESESAAVIERSLRETSDLFRKQVNTSNALRGELQYLYHIFLRRNKCSYKMHFANSPHFFLFTIYSDAGKADIIVYAPRNKAEIANVYAHPCGNELVIDDMVFNLTYCDKYFGELLLGELLALAESFGMESITGHFGRSDNKQFNEMASFLQNAGFDVGIAPGEQTADLLYRVKPAVF